MANDNFENAANTMIGAPRTYTVKRTFTMVTGEKRTGEFTARMMSILQRAQLGVARAKMLDGADNKSIDQVTDNIIYIMTYLDTLLVKRPAWFKWDDLEDYTEIRNLYDEVYQWGNSFRTGNISGADEGNSAPATNAQDMEGYEAL